MSAVVATSVVAIGVSAGGGVAFAATPQQPNPPSAQLPTETTPAVPAAPASAFVATPSGVVARAATTTAWHVSLVADNTDISEGETTNLTAYASSPVNGSGYAIVVAAFATPQSPFFIVASCESGSSCAGTADWANDPITYIAYVVPVADLTNPSQFAADSVATSNTIEIPSSNEGGGGGGPQPWEVELSVSPTLLPRGKSVTVVAVANQSVAGTLDEVQVYSLATGQRVGACGMGNGCTFTVPWTPHTEYFQAAVAPPSFVAPTDALAVSQVVTVSGLDWSLILTNTGSDNMTAELGSNRSVGAASSTALMIYDLTTRTVLKRCTSGRVCEAPVPHKGDAAIGYVVPDTATQPDGVWLARTGWVSFPEGSSGGNNPAGLHDGHPCTCDPVDPSDGALHESATDIVVPGRGLGLALTRSYESATASVVSRFGYGWSDAYSMQLIALPSDDGTVPMSLADATRFQIVQENGEPVTFAEQADGSFATSSDMLASLVHNGDGSYTFTRMRRSSFTFDGYGNLVAESDLHGNTTRLAYDDLGRLSAVTDPAGRSLAYSYNDDGSIARVSGPAGRFETYGYDAAGNLVSATDQTGAAWRYGYDDLHELTSITDPDGRTTTNTFDDLGRVATQTDGRGMTTTFAYGDSGQTLITHPAGNLTTLTYRDGLLVQRTEGSGADAATWQYQYDPATHGLAEVVDPNHHMTAYTHDAAGDITSVTDAAGNTTTFTFDALGDQTRVVDASGDTTVREFDASGDLLKATDPTGATTTYTYDGTGDRTSVTDADGHATSYSYDDAGYVVSSTDAAGATTKMSVDEIGETTAVTDPLGRTTSYGFDESGLLVSTTTANDETTSYTYDAAGQRLSTTDATGRTWSYEYDGAGNLTRTTNPDGSFVSTSYDPDGRKSSVSDSAGNTSTFAYDGRGNLLSSIDPTGATTTYTYDGANRLMSSTSPNGGVTSFGYDADDRTTSVTDAVGGVSHTAYDAAGRIVSVVDPMGNATSYAYDSDGRLTATTRADGTTESSAYDPVGLLLSTTDAAGHVTSYGYDADNRRVSSTDANGRTRLFDYDAASQLTSTTDAAGRVATDSYDPAGRLVGVDYSDASTPSLSYSYDAAGRRLSMSDGTGTTTYTYDPAGQLTSASNPVSGTVGYDYDGLGRVSAITYPDGRVVSRGYDAANRLVTESDGSGNTTNFSYDADGNLVAIDYPNGVVQQQVFDPADRMTSTSISDHNGNVLDSFAYQVNPLGLATSVSASGTNGPAPATQSYSYDPLSQLTGVDTTGASGTAGSPSGTFTYDSAGNVTGLPDGSTLSYDPTSELTGSVGPGAIPTSYGFDAVGDRVSQTTGGLTSTFGYDQSSQLTSVSVPGRSPYHLLAAGEFFSLAVRGDGSVRAWGDNSHGEIGDGGACGTTCPTEVTVPGLPTILQVAAGNDHALAASTDGRVFAWGSNNHGQLGNGTTADAATPVQVSGLTGVVEVAAAGDSSFALTADGKVYAWGENDDGQLGDGTTTDSPSPVLVQGLPQVVDISAGALPDGPTHVLAATASGQVYAWGDSAPHPADPDQANDPGASGGGNDGTGGGGSAGGARCKTDNGVGNGATPGNGKGHGNGDGASGCKSDNGVGNGGTPGNGKGHSNSASYANASAHSNEAPGNGSSNGQGNGGIPGNGNGHQIADLSPVLVDGVDHVVQVAAGGASSYALTSAGAVYAWGDNHYGELGLGTPPNVQSVGVPTQIAGLPQIKMVAAGGAHAVALSTRGQVFGWGDDNTGQIGPRSAVCTSDDPKNCPAPQLIDGVTASAVAAGYVHSLIATVDEHVVALGRDAEGELGDGYAHPATQVGPAGDRDADGTPDGGDGGAKVDLTQVVGLAQVRPQAPVTATYTYTGDGLRATATTTVDDTTTVVPATTTATYAWDTLAGVPSLLSDGAHDYMAGPGGLIVEQADVFGKTSADRTVFLHADRLGSTRLLTDAAGQPAAAFTYTPTGVRVQADGLGLLPYAQGIPPAQPGTVIGFAGAITDAGTGFAYLTHRYLDPASDQFITLDPALQLTGQPYSYASGDPANLTDPTGLGGATNPFGGNFWTKGNFLSDPVQKRIDCGSSIFDALIESYDPVYGDMEAYSAARDNGNSVWASMVMAYNPAYQAVDGYYNEIQAAEQGQPLTTQLKYGVQAVAGVAGTVGFATGVASGISGISGIATRAGTTDLAAAEEGTPIFRGVAEGHNAYDDALQGVARPGDPLGHSDRALHNRGFTYNSRLTSWSTDPEVAQQFAGKNGVVLRTTIEELQSRGINVLQSPDLFGESEVLVEGIVRGLGFL
jgi:RHS repeat-associated protein